LVVKADVRLEVPGKAEMAHIEMAKANRTWGVRSGKPQSKIENLRSKIL
jgi:hypothetical protein